MKSRRQVNINKQVIKDVEKTIMLRKKREMPRDVYRAQATHPRLTGRPTTSPIGRTDHGRMVRPWKGSWPELEVSADGEQGGDGAESTHRLRISAG